MPLLRLPRFNPKRSQVLWVHLLTILSAILIAGISFLYSWSDVRSTMLVLQEQRIGLGVRNRRAQHELEHLQPRRPRFIFHIGPHKTATTSVQCALMRRPKTLLFGSNSKNSNSTTIDTSDKTPFVYFDTLKHLQECGGILPDEHIVRSASATSTSHVASRTSSQMNSSKSMIGLISTVFRQCVRKYACREHLQDILQELYSRNINAIMSEEFVSYKTSAIPHPVWGRHAQGPSYWTDVFAQLGSPTRENDDDKDDETSVSASSSNSLASTSSQDEFRQDSGRRRALGESEDDSNDSSDHFHYLQAKQFTQSWNVTIVVTYRRWYEFLLSSKLQFERVSAKRRYPAWPNHHDHRTMVVEPVYPRLLEYMQNRELAPYPYVDEVLGSLNQVREKFPEINIQLLNMHEPQRNDEDDADSGGMVSKFMCDVFDSPDLCRQSRLWTDPHLNTAVTRAYDVIAVAAWQKRWLPSSWSREEAVQRLQEFHQEMLQKTEADLPLACPTHEELLPLLEESHAMEAKIVPDFYQTSFGHESLTQDFWKTVSKQKFCSIDANTILESSEWHDFFLSLQAESNINKTIPNKLIVPHP